MHSLGSYLAVYIIGWIVFLAMVPIVLRRQMTPGASLAWLGIAALHPFIGLTLYLLVGESRLGPRRAARHRDIIARTRGATRQAEEGSEQSLPPQSDIYQPMVLQTQHLSGLAPVGGNAIQFLVDTPRFVNYLASDIAAATKSVNLLYYIFTCDSSGQQVAGALAAAARRGVQCRLLVDALASRAFLHKGHLLGELRAAGVQVAAALPVAPIRRHLARMDMRNHRKLAIIDDQLAYAGSHNLINADYGGRRGNPWCDLTGRLSGPVVAELAMTFAEDWAFETGQEIALPGNESHPIIPAPDQVRDVLAQVAPTGPSLPKATYRRLLLAAIQSARRELILTTPYFVPDEPTLLSLMMATDRGVDVKLIIPEHPDHFFTAAAGRSHFQTLLASGVKIFRYSPGLIHAKTTTVDDAFSVFGSANLDVRSFSLNFELSLVLYGSAVTGALRAIQMHYLSQSSQIDLRDWSARPALYQYADRAVALLSPLL